MAAALSASLIDAMAAGDVELLGIAHDAIGRCLREGAATDAAQLLDPAARRQSE